MLFSLTNDSFARAFGDIGYLTNQLNKSDRVYDQNGKFFIDYTYCKGCGICAHECPAQCIAMAEEVHHG